jgi:hypothetical protein
MKKVEVRKTKDGKGRGLFAMEDIEKDESKSMWAKLNTKEQRTIILSRLMERICVLAEIRMVDQENT